MTSPPTTCHRSASVGRHASQSGGRRCLYVYAGNDPISHRDPSGLDFRCVMYITNRHTISLGTGEIDDWATYCWDDGDDEATSGGVTPQEPWQPGGGTGGAGPGAPGVPSEANPHIASDSAEACRVAKLLLAGSLVSDAGFFLTGGLSGILSFGRAGVQGIRGLLRAAPLVGKLEYVFAQGQMARGAAEVAGAYLGTRGVGVAGVAGLNVAGVLTIGSSVGGVLISAVPLVGSAKAYLDMRAACGPGGPSHD